MQHMSLEYPVHTLIQSYTGNNKMLPVFDREGDEESTYFMPALLSLSGYNHLNPCFH